MSGSPDAPAAPDGPGGPRAMLVVVPAHDEEQLLPRCLDALGAAVAVLRRAAPGVDCRCAVVLDACSDRSAAATAAHPWVEAVVVGHRNVGRARADGVRHLRRGLPVPPDRTWLASTDADSVVPPGWLRHQHEQATAGVDLLLGMVRPHPADLGRAGGPALGERWHERHLAVDGHPHVHGANLGVRLSTFDTRGGFAPVPTGEDVGLVAAARQDPAVVCRASAAEPVVTSARLRGRSPAGFADYLADLAGGG